jgi:hypothetical protein
MGNALLLRSILERSRQGGMMTNEPRTDERLCAFISNEASSTAVAELASFLTFDCMGMKLEQMVVAVEQGWPKLPECDIEAAFHLAADAACLRSRLILEAADKHTDTNVVQFPVVARRPR